ncbi:MAG: cupin domain-containing protein [Flavobacteriales bacterium]|nr:cupin domain-containing protein [Flavobacteriales bacterium]
MSRIDELVEALKLKPHPEGGFFRENYRSERYIPQEALHKAYRGSRSQSTAIYFLLPKTSFSAWHRIHQDEIWHHYEGGVIRIHMISILGNYARVDVGKDLAAGQEYQVIIPGQTWFACEVVEGDYALAGCTVAPGFDFSDFQMPTRAEMLGKYSEHEEVITRLTRE